MYTFVGVADSFGRVRIGNDEVLLDWGLGGRTSFHVTRGLAHPILETFVSFSARLKDLASRGGEKSWSGPPGRRSTIVDDTLCHLLRRHHRFDGRICKSRRGAGRATRQKTEGGGVGRRHDRRGCNVGIGSNTVAGN